MSLTLTDGTSALTSAAEMRATLAPISRARRALWRRWGAWSGPARTSIPTCWKPGPPSPPMTSRQRRNTSAAALPAHVRRRASGGAGGDELLFDEDDAPGFLAREMVGEAGAVHATADDHDVRHAWGGP